jgi:NADPH:quinone reductase-like Zn-dependent oxidoreductase
MTRIVITALVVFHLVASFWHGSAHAQLAIALPPEKTIFVYVVILIAPIVAAVLLWTRYVSIGLWVFFLSMLGALLFGAYHHYVLVSSDNIGHLPVGSPESHSQFITSAAVIALLELTSALYGAFCIGSHYASLHRGQNGSTIEAVQTPKRP